jgi:hypothetical protein
MSIPLIGSPPAALSKLSQSASDAPSAGPQDAAPGSALTITSIVSVTNPDGSVTTTTSYANGSTATSTEPKQSSPYRQSTLNAGNSSQLATLLSAQGQPSSNTNGYALYGQSPAGRPRSVSGGLNALT